MELWLTSWVIGGKRFVLPDAHSCWSFIDDTIMEVSEWA